MHGRRGFLKSGIAGAGAAGMWGMPQSAAAQAASVRWRLASSFPKSLDTTYNAAELLARRVAAITGNRFQIRVFSGGELVPPQSVGDAVNSGAVECGHSASSYFAAKNSAFSIATGLPFGMNMRQQSAWWHRGAGARMLNESYRRMGMIGFAGGNTGAHMGGWFRKEIRTLKDVKGLKIAVSGYGGQVGFGGRVYAAMGAIPTTVSGGEVYRALETGALDGAELAGPYDDERLGLSKVAPYYCYPGWCEPGQMLHFFVNLAAWEKLTPEFKAAFEAAAHEADMLTMAEYDAKNPAALQRLVNSGAELHAFPTDFLRAAYDTAQAVYADEAAKNPDFRRIFDDWSRFLADEQRWFRIGESPLETFRPAPTKKR